MRDGRWAAGVALGAMLAVAGCGGGDGSGGGVPVAGVAPTPTSTPTTAPSPGPIYARVADLTGDQRFATACASIALNGAPPQPSPSSAFGTGLTLESTAAAGSYRVSGETIDLTFAAADLDAAAPAGTRSYLRRIDGVPHRLTFGTPMAGGSALDYTRGFTLGTVRSGITVQYGCAYGVPTLATDLPAGASVPFGKVAVNGTAYAVEGAGGTPRTYSVAASTATLTLEPARGVATLRVVLLGNLLTATGTAATSTELGTFEGSLPIDRSLPSVAGQIGSSNRSTQISSVAGWFFGPQAREAALLFSLYAVDPPTDTRMTVTGRVLAIQ